MFEEKKDELKDLGNKIINIINDLSDDYEVRVKGIRGEYYTPDGWKVLKSAIKNGSEKGIISPSFVQDIGKFLDSTEQAKLQHIVDKYKEVYDAVYSRGAVREGYFSPSLKRVRDIYDFKSGKQIISIDDYCRISGDTDCCYPLISISLFLALIHDNKINTDHDLDFAYPLVSFIKLESQYFKNIIESIQHDDLLPLVIRKSESRHIVEAISGNKTVIESINVVLQRGKNQEGDVFRWSYRKRGGKTQIDVNYCYSIDRSFVFVS